ncbi:S24 family peptidase [Allopontixanthobacter sp.]|uniref:S24 family peptidase n=1 Tax=Allopontixanthobacter sp. TaxID=2906452 RepID=UPI002AB90502|nr:S24 family peptidase [Allopontixanthobacter sp.]MDZ4308415.1 S24 family peptidase [Allopontixanthobacter sp.]
MDELEQDRRLLEALIAYSGTTAAKVASKARIAPSTLHRPLNGSATTRLGRTTLNKLQEAYPGFPGWNRASERQMSFKHEESVHDDTIELEQIDLRYGLGGTFADSPVEVERRSFSREWLRSITNIAPRHLFWAIGDGDSMEPTIRSGEILLIDRSQESPRMDDRIWALTHGEIGMIKRLRHLPDGTVELHSDNHLVRPQAAADGELHIIGRVVAVVRRL